jgi:hypothetical protein
MQIDAEIKVELSVAKFLCFDLFMTATLLEERTHQKLTGSWRASADLWPKISFRQGYCRYRVAATDRDWG